MTRSRSEPAEGGDGYLDAAIGLATGADTRCPICGAEDLGACECDPEAVNAALAGARA